MAEVFPKDVLLRVGGRTLARHGYLAVAGARKALIEVPITFSRADATTCATYVDRDGFVRKAAAGVPRVEWVDLDGDGIRETPGILLEGSRAQLVAQPENFGHASWTIWTGTPTLTSGQADPSGGTAAYSINDDNAAADEAIQATVAFTGDGTKAIQLTLRAGTAAKTSFGIFDNTAAAWRAQVEVTWSGGVPTAAIVVGGGTVFPVVPLTGGWYRINVAVNSIVAANSNRFLIYGATTGNTPVGTTFIFGANAWDAPFPSSYTGSQVTRAADSFTVPFNFGPIDLTVLVRLARPVWADASGDIGIFPNVYTFGVRASGSMESSGGKTARTLSIEEWTDVSHNTSQSPAIPAGASLAYVGQYKNFKTAPQVAEDIGSGMSGFSSAATPMSSYGSQTLALGFGSIVHGVILDLMVCRDLHTLSEMLAVP